MSFMHGLLDLSGNNIIGLTGFIETLLTVMKITLSYVPAGVYGSLMPDTSLFAHSKASTAITHSYVRQKELAFRLLGVDINDIQKFIKLIAQHKAASKLIRGKSLYIELLQRAVTTYLLRQLKLTWANVIGYEGGKVLIIKQPSNISKNIIKTFLTLESEELMGELGLSVAESPKVYEPITLEHLPQAYSGDIRNLSDGTYAKALLELHKSLLKFRYSKKYVKGYTINYEFDRLTHTPIPMNMKKLGFEVKDSVAKYINEIAPEAFEILPPEEYYSPRRSRFLSLLTHTALVLGHVARNLIALIELNLGDSKRYSNLITNLVNELNKLLSEEELRLTERRMWRILVSNLSLRIGLAEFKTLNTAYILVASDEVTPNPWDILNPLIKTLLGKVLKECLSKDDTVKIIVINNPENVIPPTNKLEYIKEFQNLVKKRC